LSGRGWPPEKMFSVGLVRPKYWENVGGVVRAAGCYGASMVQIEGERNHAKVRRAPTDTAQVYQKIPVIFTEDIFATIPVGVVPIAVDLVPGAVSLVDFVHPRLAIYIFGPEDGTLGKAHLERCAASVYVPTDGCMNLAAAANVIMYDRLAKAKKLC